MELTLHQVRHFQLVQNAAARLITGSEKTQPYLLFTSLVARPSPHALNYYYLPKKNPFMETRGDTAFFVAVKLWKRPPPLHLDSTER